MRLQVRNEQNRLQKTHTHTESERESKRERALHDKPTHIPTNQTKRRLKKTALSQSETQR